MGAIVLVGDPAAVGCVLSPQLIKYLAAAMHAVSDGPAAGGLRPARYHPSQNRSLLQLPAAAVHGIPGTREWRANV